MTDWGEFDRCRAWIEDALHYNLAGHTINDVVHGLSAGDLVLHPGRNSVIITEHTETPSGNFMNFFIAGGDLDELAEMVGPIEQWARDKLGVKTVALYGRRGWERSFMKKLGYRPIWTVMVKELT